MGRVEGYLPWAAGMNKDKPSYMKPSRLAPLLGVLALLFSCENSRNQKDAEEFSRALSDSTSVTGLTGDSVKLVKTAATNVKVKDVAQSLREVSALTQKLGGMLTLQNMEAVEQGKKEFRLSADSLLVFTAVVPRADITARVPSEALEAFLFAVADLGYLTQSSHLQVDDKSLLYLENALRQKSRAEVLSQPSAKPQSSASTLRTIAVRDEAIAQHMANRAIDAEVNYSTVNLNLYQNAIIRREVIANPYLDSYNLSFWKQLGDALENGWVFFLNFLVALAHLWMFLLSGVIIYTIYKCRVQKS